MITDDVQVTFSAYSHEMLEFSLNNVENNRKCSWIRNIKFSLKYCSMSYIAVIEFKFLSCFSSECEERASA